MRSNWLKVLVALSAIMIAGSAAYFSVTGLGILFSGAAIAVMIMAGSLEFAKLVSATYLKQRWSEIHGFNKWYLSFAVGILMLITSAGIFGYLSNAFQQQNLSLQKVERDIEVYQTQINRNEKEIERYTTQLTNQQNIRNSQESNLSKQIDKDKSTLRVTQMIRSADREITNISKRIDELTKQNNVLMDSINVIKNTNINLEREVGGFRFVAEAFNVDLKSVVKFFIILIVIVFDPLAIALVLAFNQLIMTKKEDEIKEDRVEVDVRHDVEEAARLKLSEEDLKILEKHLSNPPQPNDNLKQAAKEYQDRIRRQEILSEMMQKDQELGLYDPPFDNPLVKEPVVSDDFTIGPDGAFEMTEEILEQLKQESITPALSDEEVREMFMDEWERKFDLVKDDEEFSNNKPTEEEESENFSTIEPNSENSFQDNQEDYEGQFQEWNKETVPEPFATPEELETSVVPVEEAVDNVSEITNEDTTSNDDSEKKN